MVRLHGNTERWVLHNKKILTVGLCTNGWDARECRAGNNTVWGGGNNVYLCEWNQYIIRTQGKEIK